MSKGFDNLLKAYAAMRAKNLLFFSKWNEGQNQTLCHTVDFYVMVITDTTQQKCCTVTKCIC